MSSTFDALLTGKSWIVLCAVLAIASVDIARRIQHRKTHLLFAAIFGTSLSAGLIRTVEQVLLPGTQSNPYTMALGFVLVVLGWKALFGPWESSTKAAMLGTFLFWVSLHLFSDWPAEQRSVRLIAAVTALVPALIWCFMFLKYHRERMGNVVLLFLAGMLSTAPILFYDALVRRGVEMQFFFFRLQPESFTRAVETFVHGRGEAGLKSVLIAAFLTFLFVGIVEECSKYWVLSRSAKQLFTSIDDVLQLSIIVAIGFSFAENIINPVYFTAFVREYLFHASAPDIPGFLSNVLGRSVLTSMVHIVSTGVLGYFLGLAIFAGSYLRERKEQGHAYRILAVLHRVLRLQTVSIFRVQMLATGLLCAILLHGVFNFLVTIPDLLPGSPQTLADLIGSEAPTFLNHVPLLLLPALLYVVGGFWLLTSLFLSRTNMEERGHLILQEEYVDDPDGEREDAMA